ncbi:MAG: DUF1203 domain-containing protein [Pseudomonadota bacterium]
MAFQVHALPVEPFAPLFALPDAALDAHHARRVTVEQAGYAPCRVSLSYADAGETVLLVNHLHLDVANPYRSRHAVYVREGAQPGVFGVNELPETLRRSFLSVRWFDATHDMIDADLVDGDGLAAALDAGFAKPQVEYAHLHYAKRGCYAARVTRA